MPSWCLKLRAVTCPLSEARRFKEPRELCSLPLLRSFWNILTVPDNPESTLECAPRKPFWLAARQDSIQCEEHKCTFFPLVHVPSLVLPRKILHTILNLHPISLEFSSEGGREGTQKRKADDLLSFSYLSFPSSTPPSPFRLMPTKTTSMMDSRGSLPN